MIVGKLFTAKTRLYVLSFILLAVFETDCTSRSWKNPLDPESGALWVELVDSPPKVGLSYKHYLFNCNDEILFLSTTNFDKKIYKLSFGEFPKWELLKQMTDASFTLSATLLDNTIYILSDNQMGAGYFLNTYDPLNNSFSQHVTIKNSSGELDGLLAGSDKLYLCASEASGEEGVSLHEVDPELGSLSEIASTNTVRKKFTPAFYDSEILLIGGEIFKPEYDVYQVTNMVESYSLASGSWSEKESIPVLSNVLHSLLFAGSLYVFDGNSGDVYTYQSSGNTWTKKSRPSYISDGFMTAAPYENVLMVGGTFRQNRTSRYRYYTSPSTYKVFVYNVFNE